MSDSSSLWSLTRGSHIERALGSQNNWQWFIIDSLTWAYSRRNYREARAWWVSRCVYVADNCLGLTAIIADDVHGWIQSSRSENDNLLESLPVSGICVIKAHPKTFPRRMPSARIAIVEARSHSFPGVRILTPHQWNTDITAVRTLSHKTGQYRTIIPRANAINTTIHILKP